jgi:hypothetical protein
MRFHRTESIVAGILFIVATSATMAGFVLTDPILGGTDVAGEVSAHRSRMALGAVLETTNALASAGIAMALFPIIWRYVQALAVAYLGLRVMEASLGLLAATGLLILLSPESGAAGVAIHKWAFLMVLSVFSVSTLVLYPVLFIYRIVPVVLSVWGLVGGVMLLVSCMLILSGWTVSGSMIDTLLSLPIWVNEMALALWLLLRGVDLSHPPAPSPEQTRAAQAH